MRCLTQLHHSRHHRLSFRERCLKHPHKRLPAFLSLNAMTSGISAGRERDTHETRGQTLQTSSCYHARKRKQKRKGQHRNKEDCFKTWNIWCGSALCHSCFISPQDLQITGKCEVKQPLLWRNLSNLNAHTEISDFGLETLVWDIVEIFSVTLEEMHVRLFRSFLRRNIWEVQ